jgi:hypothetical protein
VLKSTFFREMLREVREAGRHSFSTQDGLELPPALTCLPADMPCWGSRKWPETGPCSTSAAEAGAALSVYRAREFSNGAVAAILEITYP